MTHRSIYYIVGIALTFALSHNSGALSVTQPSATTVIQAGDDYATQVLGDAWDMQNSADIDIQESNTVSAQTFTSGTFSGTTAANGSFVYPLFMGFASSVNLSRGSQFPIVTSHYRYVTYKLRVNQSAQPQFTRVVGILDGNSYDPTLPKQTVVESPYTAPLPNNMWQIVHFDMVSQNDGLFFQWTDFPQLTGLRIDPASTNASGAYAAAPFNIKWVRLTAPASVSQTTAVTWTDSGYTGSYSVTALDADNTSFLLTTSATGTSFQADMSFLAPGQYRIQVARNGSGGTTAVSPVFRINSPPQITITSPSARGDQSTNFADVVLGNPWGPIDASDFSDILNFKNISYAMPSGSFYGRPTSGDPNLFFNLGAHAIDTSVYRSLCFSMRVFGPRSVGQGSIARLLWGSPGAVSTSQDIVLDDNVGDTITSEYCIPDLSVIPLEPDSAGGTWSGTKTLLRLDPDELVPPTGCNTADTCHDVQLSSFILSPFASANPNYTFTWSIADTDNSSVTLRLSLDPDNNPNNGNDHAIYSQLTANGVGTYAWPGTSSIPSGTYHVLATLDDGVNSVSQYADGLIIVSSDDIFSNGFDVN